MIKKAWEFARKNHTRERFEKVAFNTIEQILRQYPKIKPSEQEVAH